MQSIKFSRYGNPADVLHVVDTEIGAPGAGEVLVDVEATPIHPADILLIKGEYGSRPALPATPGNEGVGRVRETGEDVANVKAGDLVLLPIGSGTWCQRMCVPARGLFALPARCDPYQLSLVSVNSLTASLLLSEIVSLAPGDWIVQNAANSSVGQFLISLAKRRGIHTANVVRSGGVERRLHELGADAVIVNRGQDLGEEIVSQVGSASVKLAIDAVGGPATAAMTSCLSAGETLVNYGIVGDHRACHVPASALIFRGLQVRGFWLAQWIGQHPDEVSGHLRELVSMVDDNQLHAEIEGTYPLQRIKPAIKKAMQGRRDGKILLTPDSHW